MDPDATLLDEDGSTSGPAVLVVGAGPTGLALAAQLEALGTAVRIIDRASERAHESRALVVHPRTLEILRSIGVSETLVARGNDAVQMRLDVGGRVVRAPLFDIGLEDTAFPFMLFISQRETEAVLNEHLASRGIHVERGVELVGLRADERSVACALRHPDGAAEELRVGYVAGCDGAHSRVRHLAGIPFAGGAYPQTFALADLEVDGLERDRAHVFLRAPGVLLFFPLGRTSRWRMLGIRRPTEGERPAEPSLADLQAIADAFTDGALRLRDPVWRTHFRLHHRQAARYRAGRIFLAGDAAHVHSPAGAQGMNTGIQDAWNLGWKLALVDAGVADAALLDSYERERWPIARSVLRLTDRATRIATAGGRFAGLIRARVAPLVIPRVLRASALRAFGFRTLAQVRVGYRHSPAVEEGRPSLRRGPRAGDRLPDARAAGVHEALAAPTHHLLLCGSVASWDRDRLARLSDRYDGLVAVHHLAREAAAGVLHDADGEALARLGVERTAQYLVRPDGYIGYRAAGCDLGGVERYLARWLPRPGAVRRGPETRVRTGTG